jgi:peptidoglycan/xylan/chitin deacetylase (PgdA/CDA1 family)
VILAYHNVVPHGEKPVGDLPLHLDQRAFGEQLDRILETHEIVPLSEIGSRPPDPGRARAIVTFDDAYRSALTAGFEELKRRGLPGTVFVAPGLLGTSGFWWDRLASPDGRGLSPELRSHALVHLGGRQDLILEWAKRERLDVTRRLPDHAAAASESEVLRLTGSTPFVSWASHTWTHPNLARASRGETEEEMQKTRRWLDASGLQVVDAFAYPYGLASSAAEVVVADFSATALLVEGGAAEWAGEWRGRPLALPRVSVPRGLSPDGLELRLAGVLS